MNSRTNQHTLHKFTPYLDFTIGLSIVVDYGKNYHTIGLFSWTPCYQPLHSQKYAAHCIAISFTRCCQESNLFDYRHRKWCYDSLKCAHGDAVCGICYQQLKVAPAIRSMVSLVCASTNFRRVVTSYGAAGDAIAQITLGCYLHSQSCRSSMACP